jgi:hypothetical protein
VLHKNQIRNFPQDIVAEAPSGKSDYSMAYSENSQLSTKTQAPVPGLNIKKSPATAVNASHHEHETAVDAQQHKHHQLTVDEEQLQQQYAEDIDTILRCLELIAEASQASHTSHESMHSFGHHTGSSSPAMRSPRLPTIPDTLGDTSAAPASNAAPVAVNATCSNGTDGAAPETHYTGDDVDCCGDTNNVTSENSSSITFSDLGLMAAADTPGKSSTKRHAFGANTATALSSPRDAGNNKKSKVRQHGRGVEVFDASVHHSDKAAYSWSPQHKHTLDCSETATNEAESGRGDAKVRSPAQTRTSVFQRK